MTARTQRTRGLAPPLPCPFFFLSCPTAPGPLPHGCFSTPGPTPAPRCRCGFVQCQACWPSAVERPWRAERGRGFLCERRGACGRGEAESVEQGETGGQGAEARKQETEQQLTRTMELLKGESRLMAAAFSGGRGRELRACAGLTRCRDARLSRRFGRCWPCSCLARVVRTYVSLRAAVPRIVGARCLAAEILFFSPAADSMRCNTRVERHIVDAHRHRHRCRRPLPVTARRVMG